MFIVLYRSLDLAYCLRKGKGPGAVGLVWLLLVRHTL